MKTLAFLVCGLILAILMNGCCCSPCGGGGACGGGGCGMQGAYYTPPCNSGCGI